MLSIYRYSKPSAFLKDAWSEKKQKNAAFSMRAWAKRLGFENNAPLSLMLSGKRPVPKKYVPRMAEDLGLNENETLYLDALIDFENARTEQEKSFHFTRLKSLSKKEPIKMLELEHFKYLGDPIHMCLLEMSDLDWFVADPKFIQSHLAFSASLERIEEAIDRLLVLGLLEQEADGKLVRRHPHITSRADVEDLAGQDLHKHVSRWAAELIGKQPLAEREYNSYALNIRKESLPRAKKMIRNFVAEFIKHMEAPAGEGEATYQFNVQMFNLTQVKEDLKKQKKGGEKE